MQTATFSEVNPFLWELPCDLCIKEARAVEGVTSCGDVFLETKKKKSLIRKLLQDSVTRLRRS